MIPPNFTNPLNTKASKDTKATAQTETEIFLDNNLLQDYLPDTLIGEGAFSYVFRLIEKKTNKKFALKLNKRMKNSTIGIGKDLVREISVMNELSRKYIVKPTRQFLEPRKMIVYVIYDYYQFHLGELSETIDYSEENIKIIMKRLIECVLHMHRFELFILRFSY